MDFTPGPVWQQVRQPVLLLKGGRDQNSPADHAMRWRLGERVPPPLFASGYLQTMVRWTKEQRGARR